MFCRFAAFYKPAEYFIREQTAASAQPNETVIKFQQTCLDQISDSITVTFYGVDPELDLEFEKVNAPIQAQSQKPGLFNGGKLIYTRSRPRLARQQQVKVVAGC